MDANGGDLPTKTSAIAKDDGVKCYVCVSTSDGKGPCYEIDCKDAPPKEDTAPQATTKAQ